MAEKSRILDLMARRESVLLSKARIAMGELAKRQAESAQKLARLESLLDARRICATGVCAAQDLRIAHRMNIDMARQMHLGDVAANALLSELAQARTELAWQDHKTQHLTETAKSTRRDEVLAREAQAANSMAARRTR